MRKKNVYFLFVILSLCLIVVSALSILYGSKSVDMETLFDALFTNKESFSISVVQARIPRTLFGILAGASLGVSGCLMQSITRNPIADPSILGINTGASLFVVVGIAFFSISSPSQYIWLGFTGAILTAILVYGIASVGQSGATPIKLALAGAATSMALMSLVNTIMLPNSQVMDSFRFWQTGSIGGAKWNMILVLLPYFILGLLLSFYLSSSLNTLALGDELATSLGINSKKVRAMGSICRSTIMWCYNSISWSNCFCWINGSPYYSIINRIEYALSPSIICIGRKHTVTRCRYYWKSNRKSSRIRSWNYNRNSWSASLYLYC